MLDLTASRDEEPVILRQVYILIAAGEVEVWHDSVFIDICRN